MTNADMNNTTVTTDSLIFDGFDSPADIAFYYNNTHEILSNHVGHYIEITHFLRPRGYDLRIISQSIFKIT